MTPVDCARQLCGVCSMTASDMGYEFPLLSKFLVVPSFMLILTVKDEMPLAASMVVEIGKNWRKGEVSESPV